MNGKGWKAALVGAAAAISTLARPAAALELEGEALALRRVMLSSGGVGYFEYAARVTGDGALPLPVRLDQIDDILKSIVVYDDRGGMGEVTLPGKAAANEAFRDLPFDPGSLGSPESLLVALRGAEVTVTTAEGTVTGRVLSVTTEVVQLPEKSGTTVRHRLAIAADGSIRSLILEDAQSVQIVDPALRAQLDAALSSLLSQKDRGRRTLMVHTRGEGEREVRVGFVVAVPVWKSTYRLTLSTEPAAKTADLVGLAVVENQSGAPFDDVDLTLISGNPVTFRQALYQAYYVERPEIPVEVAGRVLPRLDEGAVRVSEKHLSRTFGPSMAAPAMMGGGMAADMREAAPGYAPPAMPEATEEATQIVFHLPAPISIAAGEQALIPIVEREVPAQRVSVYQPEAGSAHPFASVLLVNDGDTSLPPGVLTTYERTPAGAVTYLGDARLAAFPAGEKRLVSFGADTKVRVDRKDHSAETLTMATLSRGTLTLTRTERIVTGYTIAGAQREPRVVIVEHARIEGFDLASPKPEDGKVEVTDTHYRFRVEVPAGETVTLTVTLARPILQTMAVLDLPAETLAAYAAAPEIPAPVREALGRIAVLRGAVDEKTAAVKSIEADMARITAEQTRIRENLKVVPAGSALATRYLTLLGEQEDRIAALETQIADARRALADAESALAAAIRAL